MSKEKHKVATIDDLPTDGSRVMQEIDGVEISVFRISENYYALANFCPHQSGPLCEGELFGEIQQAEDGWDWSYDEEEKNIACPWHAWKFDVTTGKNTSTSKYRVPTYDVEVEGEDIYVYK